jgi:hypothetical protein
MWGKGGGLGSLCTSCRLDGWEQAPRFAHANAGLMHTFFACQQELRYPLPSVPVAPSTPSSLALTPPPQLLHSAAAAALEEAAETEASQDCSEVWQPVLAQLLKATSALSPLTCTMSASTLKRSKPPKPVAAADALSLSEETEAALVLRVLEWCCGALPNGKVMEAEVAMAEAAPMVTEAVDAMDTAAADAPGAVVATTENEAPAEVNAKAEQVCARATASFHRDWLRAPHARCCNPWRETDGGRLWAWSER